ncbi:MAG: heavy-metal-associated domain-containing protein [Candidatus Marinimicrobia bacterium]|nr:heavy-metal-associated domain-containing protein [Candidatus Neomarinimicrobiota bacterium]
MSAKEVVKTYNIDGMMCGMNCPKKVVNSIIDVEGVKSCDVSFENSNAVVTFDDAKIDEQTIAKTIAKETYYKVELASTKKESFWTRLFGK